MDFANYWFSSGSGGGGGGYQIGNSLRFRGNGSYLSYTPSAPSGSSTVWTVSFWFKNSGFPTSSTRGILGPKDHSYIQLYYSTQSFQVWDGTVLRQTTSKVFRDPHAWYHVVYQMDANANGLRMWVNGEFIWGPVATSNSGWNSSVIQHRIGFGYGSTTANGFNGYIAEYHQIDGTAYAPTEFGEFNDDGVWVPIEPNVNYGGKGCHLDFSDPANIGADRSGNGNNWTPTGFELTNANSGLYDLMLDSPTHNYPTLTPLKPRSTDLRDANLSWYSTYGEETLSSQAIVTGKWYAECQVQNNNNAFGVTYAGWSTRTASGTPIGICSGSGQGTAVQPSATKVFDSGANWGAGDTVGLALDADNKVFTLYRNGTKRYEWNNFTKDGPYYLFIDRQSSSGHNIQYMNFGQRPFQQTPPSGFQALPASDWPNATFANPSEHFQVITDTGANILTNAQATFPNGLWWIKDRANSNQHQLVDSVRGGNLRINTPNETTEAAYSAPSGNSIAFCWNLVDDRSNGFDIVLYDGNSANRTVPHNLGVQPEFLMVCNRNRGSATHRIWTPFYSAAETLEINSGRSKTTENTIFNNTAPTASVFSLGNSSMNASGFNYVAYLWRSVPGFSLIGEWEANGVRDGALIECGFRPAFIMYKPYNASANWGIRTTAMSPYNPSKEYLYANGTSGQYNAALEFDILSNGFKWREDGGQSNSAGQKCLFMAFAEHPFGGGNVSPSPAR